MLVNEQARIQITMVYEQGKEYTPVAGESKHEGRDIVHGVYGLPGQLSMNFLMVLDQLPQSHGKEEH